jgi:carbon storage regulator CsrA
MLDLMHDWHRRCYLRCRSGDPTANFTFPCLTEEKEMLILSRKAGQSIQIGDRITITVTKIKGNAVQVGIDAPRQVIVKRAELVQDWGEDSHARKSVRLAS